MEPLPSGLCAKPLSQRHTLASCPKKKLLAKRDEGTISLPAESVDPHERETELYDNLTLSVRDTVEDITPGSKDACADETSETNRFQV